MIKCYIVQNAASNTEEGSFSVGKFYIAKVDNKVNTLSILDDKKNWIPFKWYRVNLEDIQYSYAPYFDLWDVFYVNNKKELNEYVPTTKFYKDGE